MSNDAGSASSNQLQALQESAEKNRKLYQFDKPNKDLIESFDAPRPKATKPHSGSPLQVEILCEEFTSLCPMTGQPDYGKLIIRYIPRDRCVESKSLKLYLMGFRNHGAFAETIVQIIMDDFVDKIKPQWIEVVGEFTPRGGLAFKPTATYAGPLPEQVSG